MINFNGNARVPYNKTIVKKTLPVLSYIRCKFLSVAIQKLLEFLNHLPTTVNPNSELISFDVVSLYTNIPHDLRISVITFWLENKRNIVQHRFSKEFILETVKIIPRSSLIKLGTSQHSGLSIMSIKWLNR
jgi:hypothetical protein